jgi:hypothetical protein
MFKDLDGVLLYVLPISIMACVCYAVFEVIL